MSDFDTITLENVARWEDAQSAARAEVARENRLFIYRARKWLLSVAKGKSEWLPGEEETQWADFLLEELRELEASRREHH